MIGRTAMLHEEIDHKARAQMFHRRAQKAEADAVRNERGGVYWKARWGETSRCHRTAKRKLKRVRAQLRHARDENSLERIIRLGRLFP